jgi:hypothetical protein
MRLSEICYGLVAAFICTQAHADSCSDAISRYNSASNNFNAQIPAKFKQLFGREMSGAKLPEECRQLQAFYAWKLGQVQALLASYRTMKPLCPSSYSVSGVAPAGVNPNTPTPDLVASTQNALNETKSACQQGAVRPSNPRPSGPSPTNVSDACLSIGTPKDVGSSISGCGPGQREWLTQVRSSRKPGCPKSVYFSYTDPGTGKTQSNLSTPLSVQTCGGPATNIHATGAAER